MAENNDIMPPDEELIVPVFNYAGKFFQKKLTDIEGGGGGGGADKADKVKNATEDDLAALTKYGNLKDSGKKLSDLATKQQLNSLTNTVSNKVDKVSGKGLSTNDFTNEEKQKVDNAYSKPSGGIPENDLSQDVQDKLNSAGGGYIKPEDGIPSSDMTQEVQESLSKADNSVQQVSGKDLSTNDYTDEDKQKVDNAYSLPSGGIPSTDMTQEVQASLDKADNSVQQVQGKGLSTNDFTDEDKQNIQDALELAESNVSDISYGNSKLKKTVNGVSSDVVTANQMKTDMGLSQIKDLGDSFISSGNCFIAKIKVNIACELDINLYAYSGGGHPTPSIIRMCIFSPVSPLTERSGNKFSKLIVCQKTPYGNYYPEVAIECIERSYSSYDLILSVRSSSVLSSLMNVTVKWEIRSARADRPVEVEFGNDYNSMASGATGLTWDKENVLDADSIEAAIGLSESAYQKPQNGIPKTDLADGVQTSLDSADSAMQSIGSSDTSTDIDGTEKLAIGLALSNKGILFSTVAKLWDFFKTSKLTESTTNIGGDAATASAAKSGSTLETQLNQKEVTSNKKQSIDPTSTTDYPSSKALADYVSDAVSLAAADYISDDGEPFTSVQDLPTNTSVVSNNDYAFVTGTDEAGNTYYDRYKATVDGSTVTWGKEFRLNNSSFTAAQWSAITSGITSVLVTSYNNHLADSDIHVTTQNKTDWNAKYDKPQSGIPKSDLSQGVQDSLDSADSLKLRLKNTTEFDDCNFIVYTVPEGDTESSKLLSISILATSQIVYTYNVIRQVLVKFDTSNGSITNISKSNLLEVNDDNITCILRKTNNQIIIELHYSSGDIESLARMTGICSSNQDITCVHDYSEQTTSVNWDYDEKYTLNSLMFREDIKYSPITSSRFIYGYLTYKIFADRAFNDEDGNNIKTTYYKKPQTGIPSTDLSQEVQDLLSEVDDPEEGSLIDLVGDNEFIDVTESNGTITVSLIAETDDYEV